MDLLISNYDDVDFEKIDELGSGNFSVVYKVKIKRTDEYKAIKLFKKKGHDNETKEWLQEIRNLRYGCICD